jgi:hypothetical protein
MWRVIGDRDAVHVVIATPGGEGDGEEESEMKRLLLRVLR